MINPLKIKAGSWHKLYNWLYWISAACVIINGYLWLILHMRIHLVVFTVSIINVILCELTLRKLEKQGE